MNQVTVAFRVTRELRGELNLTYNYPSLQETAHASRTIPSESITRFIRKRTFPYVNAWVLLHENVRIVAFNNINWVYIADFSKILKAHSK